MESTEKAGMVERTIRMGENVICIVAGLMLLGMMFLGASDVVGRYIFNRPITGAMEIAQLLMGGSIFFAMAYTLAQKAHVTVDIFFIMYSPRVQAILSFIMMFISFVLFALITWQSILIAVSDLQSGKLVKVILIPLGPFKFMLPIGSMFLCLECIIQMIHLLPKALGRKED
ncbi:TRAP transporter small permease subunit [Thermodesulfobacteriota bacterium]